MATIPIIHYSLSDVGGAGAVCSIIADLLSEDHAVKIYTTECPAVKTLNEMYETELDSNQIEIVNVGGVRLSKLSKGWTAIGMTLIEDVTVLRYALFHALVRHRIEKLEPDLAIGTYGEFQSPWPTFQYIHAPLYNRHLCPGFSVRNPKIADIVSRVLDHIDNPAYDGQNQIVVTNSNWSAQQFEAAHGQRPEVVHPPVMSQQLSPDRVDWEDRERGFVMAGRIAPDKRQLDGIEIIQHLRSDGYDVHLHICGPTSSGPYADRVVSTADEHDYISYEGALPRPEYNQLLEEHRYGLHLKENEHFGMVVAEMVAAGMIPFLPDSGGQVEIVNEDPRLLFSESPEDTIKSVFQSDGNTDIRQSLSESASRYTRAEFTSACRTYISQLLR